MASESDAHIWDLGFPRWHDVSGQRSVAGLFVKRRRRGVYVLGFSNGERYVGRATDVVRRFVPHQAVHRDIVAFTFRPVPAPDIVDDERHCIHTLEAEGLQLRNLAEMSVVSGERVFDKVVSAEEQKRWIAGERPLSGEGSRPHDDDLRRRYRSRFEKFMQRDKTDEALVVLGSYLSTAVPFPHRTELSFWSLSCLPAGNPDVYCRVNLNMQEVFTLFDGGRGLRASFHLARLPFETRYGPSWERRLRDRRSTVDDHKYGPGGWDQFHLEVTPRRALSLLEDPVATEAMASFNARLMRKGPTYYATSHCIDLVTAAHQAFERHSRTGTRR